MAMVSTILARVVWHDLHRFYQVVSRLPTILYKIVQSIEDYKIELQPRQTVII